MSHGHACPQCAGVGSVRAPGLPGYVRVPCPRCGGSGLLRPTSVMGFTASEWVRAFVGAVAFLAVAYPLLVFALIAGQP